MNLVDEQHITVFQIGQHRRQVARPFQHRAGSRLDGNAHLVGDDVGERRLAEARRAENQRMVERFVTPPRRLDEDGHLFLDRALADVFTQARRTQAAIEARLRRVFGAGVEQPVRLDGHDTRSGSMVTIPAPARWSRYPLRPGERLQCRAHDLFGGEAIAVNGCDRACGFGRLVTKGDQRPLRFGQGPGRGGP